MREINCVNYLHFGDGLSRLTESMVDFNRADDSQEFLTVLNGKNLKCVDEILNCYRTGTSGIIDISGLHEDIVQTNSTRSEFRTYGCRGFSYKFYSDMEGFPYRLRRTINLRMALVADNGLFYPPRVRKYLRRHTANHYFAYDAPAIAFALGCVTRKSWYVFVMQSDLCKHGPASVREHFRGWRKVLLANIIDEARKTARYLFLCRGEDVLKSCHPDYSTPSSLPVSWKSIYDGTARSFNMNLVALPSRLNIQLYDRKRPVYAQEMYGLEFVNLVR